MKNVLFILFLYYSSLAQKTMINLILPNSLVIMN